MALYYFLGTSLPELRIGEPTEIKFEELDFLLRQNLSVSDLKKTESIRRYFDIENIRSFWSELPMREVGNFNAKTLEDALLTRFGLPEYIYQYIDKYNTPEERLEHFAELHSTFFREEIKTSGGFLQKFLIAERKVRLVLAALRAKKLKKEIAPFLQYEDLEDPLVKDILAQQDAEDYLPPPEQEELKTLFLKYENDPLELHKAYLEYRFKKVADSYGLEVFTLDRILGYMFQLILAEEWMQLNEKIGRERMDEVLCTVA
jgi:hypothetical protein